MIQANQVLFSACVAGLALQTVSSGQSVRMMEPVVSATAMSDFWAVSNSVCKAATTNWWSVSGYKCQVYSPSVEIGHIHSAFEAMALLSTSKVEVICYRNSSFSHWGSQKHHLFWITDDAVYKMSITNQVKSITKAMRPPKTLDAELDVFESAPFDKLVFYSDCPQTGFYIRRAPSETFESIYFPILFSGHTKLISYSDKIPKEVIDKLNATRGSNASKILAFDQLLKNLDLLMDNKPVIWASNDLPTTRSK